MTPSRPSTPGRWKTGLPQLLREISSRGSYGGRARNDSKGSAPMSPVKSPSHARGRMPRMGEGEIGPWATRRCKNADLVVEPAATLTGGAYVVKGDVALRGVLSPLSPVTLRAPEKKAAGVPSEANYFAYAYPLDLKAQAHCHAVAPAASWTGQRAAR